MLGLRRWKKEDQKFKVANGFLASSRPVSDTWNAPWSHCPPTRICHRDCCLYNILWPMRVKMLLGWPLSDLIQLLSWYSNIACSIRLSDPPVSAQTQHGSHPNTEGMEEKAVSQCLKMAHARDARGRCSWTSQVRKPIDVLLDPSTNCSLGH